MPEARRRILDNKRIVLMRHIIEAEGYEDRELAADLEKGFELVGEVPTSNVLPRKLLPASITTADLLEQSQRSNTALRYMTRSSGDDVLGLQTVGEDYVGGGKGLDVGAAVMVLRCRLNRQSPDVFPWSSRVR